MADDAKKRSLIEQFTTVAGVDEERARFFLEMTSWNLDLAMTNFFESNEDSDQEPAVRPRDPTPPRDAELLTRRAGAAGRTGPPAAKDSKPAPARPAPKSNIASLSSLRHDEKSDESSEEEGQAYYAGGSERTGQQILGPPKKKADANQMITNLFSAAREHGAEETEPTASSSSAGARGNVFQGRAYRLGDPTTHSEVIDNPVAEERRRVEIVLKMWKNGFSLDNGPLRDFADPQNAEFLSSVMKNQLPKELVEQARGGEVGLSLEDHRTEEYVAPKKVVQSFGGIGHRLGSPTDAVQISGVATSSAAIGACSSASAGSSVDRTLDVDPSQPTTNLQIRLADGSRLVAKFNHTHQISDVRSYIVSARPQYAGTSFVLMTTFPNKELTDETQNLTAANLLNAVLVQKMK